MSIIGKGRGRGFTDVKDATLRRPGQIQSSSRFSELIHLIDNLAIKEIVTGSKIDEIVHTINNAIQSNSLKEVFDDLHKQALEDRQFGIKLATAFSDSKVYSINDSNLRLILLQTLQKDYEDKEEIKKKSIVHFRNAISLLGEVYNSLRLNGRPMDLLATPLLQYLELLLETSEEEDIELVTTQISINGRKIHEQSPVELEDFMIRVRLVLVNRNLSARSRGMLLYVIDLANQQFAPLFGKLETLYTHEININSLIDVQRDEKDVVVIAKPDSIVNDTDNAQPFNRVKSRPLQYNVENHSISSSIKSPKQERSFSYRPNEKSPPHVNNDKPSVPRAIRGAGASDSSKTSDKSTSKKSPRGKKDKFTDEQIWSSKTKMSSKAWGHDDRFDKDYN